MLFAALFIASILILFLFYYLNLIRAQNVAVARSQAWNGALSAAEAGVGGLWAGELRPGAARFCSALCILDCLPWTAV